MLVTWQYKERNTVIQRLDPRARIIFMLCILISTMFLWDARWVAVMFVLALAQFLLARLTWRETRRFWLVIGLLALFLAIVNALSQRMMTGYVETSHLWFNVGRLSLFGHAFTASFTVEQLVFFVVQVVRIVTFGLLAIVIPSTVNPAHYGVTFRSLGIPDKFAYAMDLSFRFVPTLGRDFGMILDAQRARGYEVDKLRGGLIQKTRSMAPLVVPLVISAIMGGEDIADAMDLRAFGTGPRTWVVKLTYKPADYVVIAFSVAVLLVVTVAKLQGYGNFWVPEALLRLATG